MRYARWAVAVLMAGSFLGAADDAAAWCGRRGFAYGNVGYAAGYSFSQVGFCGPRWSGWCGPRVAWGGGWCGPRWGWGCRPWGWRGWCAPPVIGCGYGYPAWYGTTWFPSCGSVWMGAPFGGSFFSGAMVPYPTLGYPVVVPGMVPGFVSNNRTSAPAVAGLAASRPAVAPAQQVAATIRDLRVRRQAAAIASAPRSTSPVARLRAARLVAVGDRQLREAQGDPAALRQAAESYRRAAAIAADQPDTHIRQALALMAAGDRGAADAALARAVALDGRLASSPPLPAPPAAGGADPVFGDRAADAQPPMLARGQAILRQIAAQGEVVVPGGNDAPVLAGVAARWSERFAVRNAAAVAVR